MLILFLPVELEKVEIMSINRGVMTTTSIKDGNGDGEMKANLLKIRQDKKA